MRNRASAAVDILDPRGDKRGAYSFFYFLRENYLFYYEKRNECENDKTPDGESHIRYDNAHELTWYLRES